MKFEKSVIINGTRPELILGMMVINTIFERYRAKYGNTIDYVVTCHRDGKHGPASLHYVGFATDGRKKTIPTALYKEILNEIRDSLTNEFDVIDEETCFHIEFQPKNQIIRI